MENLNNNKKLLKKAKKTNQSTLGCLVVFIIIIGLFIYFEKPFSKNSADKEDVNPCLMSEDFIKTDLNFPEEADFPFLECHSTDNGDGTFTVLRKVKTKNAFGMRKNYIYKVEMRFKGGISVDIDNWELINIRSEISTD